MILTGLLRCLPALFTSVMMSVSPTCWAQWYFVSPTGDDDASGLTPGEARFTINKVLKNLSPGDTLYLLPGDYFQTIETQHSGTADKPVRILGSRQAIIRGGSRHLIMFIRHSYTNVEGFSINGLTGAGEHQEDYQKKLIEIGAGPDTLIEHISLKSLAVNHAQEECIRVRHNTRDIRILNNHISHCGLAISHFQAQQQNGEAIYIGSAPEKRHPTHPYFPRRVYIRNNHISGPVGECVDLKEDVKHSEITGNVCSGAWEEHSGAINIRGSENLIIGNQVIDTIASGIRLGGDTTSNARHNIVVSNQLINNASGGIKIMNWPNLLCANLSQQSADIKDVRMNSGYSHMALGACND